MSNTFNYSGPWTGKGKGKCSTAELSDNVRIGSERVNTHTDLSSPPWYRRAAYISWGMDTDMPQRRSEVMYKLVQHSVKRGGKKGVHAVAMGT